MQKLLFVTVACLFLNISCATSNTSNKGNYQANQANQVLFTNVVQQQNVQVIKRGDTLRIIVYVNKCFETAAPRIKKVCYPALKNLANLLKTYDGPIKVAGYTDDVFDPYSARFISQQQAEAILTFLWTRGIPATRFTAIGYGLNDPIASNRNACASGENRRVELTLETSPSTFTQQQSSSTTSISTRSCETSTSTCGEF